MALLSDGATIIVDRPRPQMETVLLPSARETTIRLPSSPMALLSDGANGFLAIEAGGYHSFALKSDGSIIGWGYNWHGQAIPPAGSDYVSIAAGYENSLAV